MGFVDVILVYIEENFENFLLFLSGLEKEVVKWVVYIWDVFIFVIEELLYNGDLY